MRKLFQNLVTLFSVVIILGFAVYTAFWFYVAAQMNRTLDDVWSHQEKYGITISGEEPRTSGFPAPPHFIFAGNVTDGNGVTYAAPEFIYQGFSVPTQAIALSAPQGLDLSGPVFKKSIHLDNFFLRIRIPADYPRRFDRDTLQAWQKRGCTIPVEKLDIARGSLRLSGDGYLSLDKDLEPTGQVSVKLSGLDDLINELVADRTISKHQALMGQSLINLISHKDEASGENTVTTALRIQEGAIFLGPLRVASLPALHWEKN